MLQLEESRLANFSLNFPYAGHLNLQKMQVSGELKTKFEIAHRILNDAITALKPLCGKRDENPPTSEQNGTLRFLANVISRYPRYSHIKSSEELLRFLGRQKEGVMWILSLLENASIEQKSADETVTLPPLPENIRETIWFLNFTAEVSRTLFANRY